MVYVLWKGWGIRFEWVSDWCGFRPLTARWFRYLNADGQVRRVEEDVPKKLESSSPAASGAPAGASHGSMAKFLPSLTGWLCDAAYEDGEPLGKTKVELQRDGTEIVATLKIADSGGRKVSVRERDPDRALKALEALLSSEQCPWQVDPYPVGGATKKRK